MKAKFMAVVWLVLLMLVACGGAPKYDSTIGVDSPAQINAKLGLSYLQHGNFEVAEAKLKRALQQDPKLGEAHHYLAELYRRTDRTDLAKDSYRKALQYSPDDMSLQNNFAVFLCDKTDYQEAIEIFARVATTRDYNRPDDALTNAGLCALRIPDVKLAERYIRQALQLNKKQPKALYEMARLSFDQQEYFRARAFIERYASVAPHSPQSMLLAAQIEWKLGDRQAVEDYANRLQTEFPDADENRQLEDLLDAAKANQ